MSKSGKHDKSDSVDIFAFDPRTMAPTSLSLIFGHSTSTTTNLVHWLVATMPCEFRCGFCFSANKSFDKMFPPSASSSSVSKWTAFQKHMDVHPSTSLVVVDHHWSQMASLGQCPAFLDGEYAAKHQTTRIIVDGHPWGNEGSSTSQASNRLYCADYIFVFTNRNLGQREIIWKAVKAGFDTFRNFSRYWDSLTTHKRCMVIDAKAIREGCTDVSKYVFYCEAPTTPPPRFGDAEWWATGAFPLKPLDRFEPGAIESFASKRILVGTEKDGDARRALVTALVDFLVTKHHVTWMNVISSFDFGFDASCTFTSLEAWNPQLLKTMASTLKSRGDVLMEKACLIFDYDILIPAWPDLRPLLKTNSAQDPLLIVLDSIFDVPLTKNELAIINPVYNDPEALFANLNLVMDATTFRRYFVKAAANKDLLIAYEGQLYCGTTSLGSSLTPSVPTANPLAVLYATKESALVYEVIKTHDPCKPLVPDGSLPRPPTLATPTPLKMVDTQFPPPPSKLRRQRAIAFSPPASLDMEPLPAPSPTKPDKRVPAPLSYRSLPPTSDAPTKTMFRDFKGPGAVSPVPAKKNDPRLRSYLPSKTQQPAPAVPHPYLVCPKPVKPKDTEAKDEDTESKPKDTVSKDEDTESKDETRAPCLQGEAPLVGATEEVPPSSWWKKPFW